MKRNFIDERVKQFWNKLPSEVKNSPDLNCFKSSLADYKIKCINLGKFEQGNFWDLTYEVLSRIEGPNYVENKEIHNIYLKENPFVAKSKFINIY